MAEQSGKLNPTLFASILSTIFIILWAILYVILHLSLWQWLANKISPPTEQEARIQSGGICPP